MSDMATQLHDAHTAMATEGVKNSYDPEAVSKATIASQWTSPVWTTAPAKATEAPPASQSFATFSNLSDKVVSEKAALSHGMGSVQAQLAMLPRERQYIEDNANLRAENAILAWKTQALESKQTPAHGLQGFAGQVAGQAIETLGSEKLQLAVSSAIAITLLFLGGYAGVKMAKACDAKGANVAAGGAVGAVVGGLLWGCFFAPRETVSAVSAVRAATKASARLPYPSR